MLEAKKTYMQTKSPKNDDSMQCHTDSMVLRGRLANIVKHCEVMYLISQKCITKKEMFSPNGLMSLISVSQILWISMARWSHA